MHFPTLDSITASNPGTSVPRTISMQPLLPCVGNGISFKCLNCFFLISQLISEFLPHTSAIVHASSSKRVFLSTPCFFRTSGGLTGDIENLTRLEDTTTFFPDITLMVRFTGPCMYFIPSFLANPSVMFDELLPSSRRTFALIDFPL